MPMKQGKIITITSVKGGVGKTTTVLNLAGIFSLKKEKVLIIDLDMYGSAIGTSLNVNSTKDIYTLINDMNNNKFTQVSDYVESYNEYIDILIAPKDPRMARKINSKYLDVVFSKLRLKYDYILVDTNHILDETHLVTLDASEEILYIVSNDLIDIKNLKTMVSIYKDMEKRNYKIILNNSKDKNRVFFDKSDFKNIVGDNVDYIIPKDFYQKNYDKLLIDGKIMTLEKNKNIKVFELIYNYIKNEK